MAVLLIAGSDSAGCSGLQADILTCMNIGVYPLTAITAITAQNNQELTGMICTPSRFLIKQITTNLKTFTIDSVKVGILPNKHIIHALANFFEKHHMSNIVVDPVFTSSSGYKFSSSGVIKSFKKYLMQHISVITPNINEAEELTGMSINTISKMKEAAKQIHALGAKYVVVKGGHLIQEKKCIDIIYDGQKIQLIEANQIIRKQIRGTGCVFSTAIASYLSKQKQPPNFTTAIKQAKKYLTQQILNSKNIDHSQNNIII